MVYVYYSGHGMMDTLTKIVCNVENSFYRYWDLELKLQVMSKTPNVFVIGVFDCCREMMKATEHVQNVIMDDSVSGDQDLYITFGCTPGKGVSQKS